MRISRFLTSSVLLSKQVPCPTAHTIRSERRMGRLADTWRGLETERGCSPIRVQRWTEGCILHEVNLSIFSNLVDFVCALIGTWQKNDNTCHAFTLYQLTHFYCLNVLCSPRGDRVRSRVELFSIMEDISRIEKFHYKSGTLCDGDGPPMRIRRKVFGLLSIYYLDCPTLGWHWVSPATSIHQSHLLSQPGRMKYVYFIIIHFH